MVKIGFVQMSPVLGNRAATIAKIEQILSGRELPRILVFPELCNSGYNFANHDQAVQTAESVEQSAFLKYLSDLCRRGGSYIVSGFNERDGGRLYNAAVLVGPEGVVGKYRKLHLFLNEKDHFQPGDLGLPVFDLGFCRLGMLVCFDWIFPEAWRVLALKRADIVCHPSNLVLPGLAQRGVIVRAVENRVFVVLANRMGTERDLTFTGCSMIVDARGTVLAEAGPTEECLMIVEIDIAAARDKAITPRNDVLADRRPEEYQLLTDSSPGDRRWGISGEGSSAAGR